MASSPRWKVYSPTGEYLAACKHIEHAAAVIVLEGDGATIRDRHTVIVWTEGHEDQPASESYDYVADIVSRRTEARRGTDR